MAICMEEHSTGGNSTWKRRKCLVCIRCSNGLRVVGADWAKQDRVGDKARKMELGADHQSLRSQGKCLSFS